MSKMFLRYVKHIANNLMFKGMLSPFWVKMFTLIRAKTAYRIGVWWGYPLGPNGKYSVRSVCLMWERTGVKKVDAKCSLGGSAKSFVFLFLYLRGSLWSRVRGRESWVFVCSRICPKFIFASFNILQNVVFQRLLFERTANVQNFAMLCAK